MVFDLDGTITTGDTYLAFLRYVLARRPWRLMHCLSLPMKVLGFALGICASDDLKRAFLRAVAGGCERQAMARLVEGFVGKYRQTYVKHCALACIARHKAKGDRIILATASLDLYAEPIGVILGADDVLSTRAAWSNDVLTGELDGPNLKGEDKVIAVQSLLAARYDAARPDVAYSDHHSDVPLLGLARAGVAIDPTRVLRQIALRRGFTIEVWT